VRPLFDRLYFVVRREINRSLDSDVGGVSLGCTTRLDHFLDALIYGARYGLLVMNDSDGGGDGRCGIQGMRLPEYFPGK